MKVLATGATGKFAGLVARRSGTLVMPWSKHSRMTYVDYRDVADGAALAFTGEELSFGTFELASPGMVDRARGAARRPGRAMFAEYDRHGFHDGNPLVLRAILQHEPRTVAVT